MAGEMSHRARLNFRIIPQNFFIEDAISPALFFEGTLAERDERLKNQYGIVLDESSKKELDKVSMYSESMEEVIENAETMVREANQKADDTEADT